MSPDKLKEVFEKEDIQFCVNSDVASTMYSLGNMFEENENYDAALGCYEMLKNVLLGKDEHIESKIEEMKKKGSN